MHTLFSLFSQKIDRIRVERSRDSPSECLTSQSLDQPGPVDHLGVVLLSFSLLPAHTFPVRRIPFCCFIILLLHLFFHPRRCKPRVYTSPQYLEPGATNKAEPTILAEAAVDHPSDPQPEPKTTSLDPGFTIFSSFFFFFSFLFS